MATASVDGAVIAALAAGDVDNDGKVDLAALLLVRTAEEGEHVAGISAGRVGGNLRREVGQLREELQELRQLLRRLMAERERK